MAVILLAPLVLELYLLVPEINELSATVIVILIIFSLCNVIIIYARIPGVKAMYKCFPDLLPAQALLLPSNSSLNVLTKQRYYKFLEEKIETFSICGSDEEMRPMVATAVTWLIAKTRNEKQFPLIYEENINFGFSYNLLGVKKFGVLLTILGLIVNVSALYLKWYKKLFFDLNANTLIASLIIDLLFLVLWIGVVNKKLVKSCGKKYAYALLAACDSSDLQ